MSHQTIAREVARLAMNLHILSWRRGMALSSTWNPTTGDLHVFVDGALLVDVPDRVLELGIGIDDCRAVLVDALMAAHYPNGL